MATQEPRLQPDTIVGGDFRVVRALGAGGMGAVYVAEQLSTGSLRALKILHRELAADDTELQRFLGEARLASRIPSDHVVQVLGAGRDADGAPWLAMELLEGESLAARVRRDGRLAPGAVQEVFAQLCHALGAAHAAGIVHRDVKPENIFLSVPRREGPRFTLKVLDFGIAKLVAQVRRTATVPVGTPLWMAPEQSEVSPEIGPPTDVWALGLLAFLLLTGKSYWMSGHSAQAGVSAFLRELLYEPLPAASVRATALHCADALPPGFDSWFDRCVCREVAGRFADANAARAELVPLLGGPSATDPSEYTPPRGLGLPADGLAATAPAAVAPGQTPGHTPGHTPGQTPGQTPSHTPGHTPGHIPGHTPGQTPGQTPAAAATDPDPRSAPAGATPPPAPPELAVDSARDQRPALAAPAASRRLLVGTLVACAGLLALVVVLLVGRGGSAPPPAPPVAAPPAPPSPPSPPPVPVLAQAPPAAPAAPPPAGEPTSAPELAATPAADRGAETQADAYGGAAPPLAKGGPAGPAPPPRPGAVSDSRAKAELPADVAADLDEAERLARAGDHTRAAFLARRALRRGGGGRAAAIVAVAACAEKDLASAKGFLAQVPRGQQARVKRECQRLGLDLDPGRPRAAPPPRTTCPPGQVAWEDGRCYQSCTSNRDCGGRTCTSFGGGRSGCL